jgi:thiamine biosynthesis protein ThiI
MKKKAIILLSDGLDSPVAAYLMMKKGFLPVFITFLTTQVYSKQMKEKVVNIVKKLSRFSDNETKLVFIPHTYNLKQIIKNCPRKLTCILCKRLMYRIAEEIGKKESTNLIVTGDILGEQASQTLANLYSYNDLFNGFIKLSPLIGLNKLNIVNLNKQIGVYEVSSEKIQSCQNFPQYPETNAKLSEIKKAEKNLDLNKLVSVSLKNIESLILSK